MYIDAVRVYGASVRYAMCLNAQKTGVLPMAITTKTAYNIDTGLPWDQLGTSVTKQKSVSKALHLSGLDWTVEKVPLSADWHGEQKAADDRWGIQRQTDGKLLGTVGGDYVPLQNENAFSFLDYLQSNGDAHLESAWSMFDGKRICVVSSLSDFTVLGSEAYRQYLLVMSSHDGSRAVQAAVTPVRIASASVEAMELASALQSFKIRHRGDTEGKVAEAKNTLKAANAYTDAFKDQAEALAKVEVSIDAFEHVLVRAFPDQKRQLAANLHSVKIIRAESPRIPDDLRGTAYGALAALTEWTNWGKDYRTEDARLKSLLFGWSKSVVTQVAHELMKV